MLKYNVIDFRGTVPIQGSITLDVDSLEDSGEVVIEGDRMNTTMTRLVDANGHRIHPISRGWQLKTAMQLAPLRDIGVEVVEDIEGDFLPEVDENQIS